MPRYVWTGPETNLGRFGTVKKGDEVVLTGKEEAYILTPGNENKHLEPWDEKKHGKKAAAPASTPPKFKPDPKDLPADFDKLPKEEQEKIVADLEQKENTRLADLKKANDRAAGLALAEKTKAELEEVVERLRADGKEVDVQKGASKAALITAIKAALGEDNRGTGEGAAGDKE